MSASASMLSRLRAYEPTRALPRDFYTNWDYFRLELEVLWYRDWLFVGHDSELGAPGDYLTAQIGEYPVLLLRDRDRNLRAFHNTCRHRGSRICSAIHGNTPRLVCPYHQWSYRLDGELIAARDMGEGFSRQDYALRPVHCAELEGYLFVCLAREAPDFEAFARQAEPYLKPHRLKDTKVAYESTIVEHANWKLVWENNRECYHCAANHPELCRSFPAGPTIMGADAIEKNPRLIESWDRWEGQGLPSRFNLAPRGQSRLARLPLIGDTVSFTMDGTPAVSRRLSDEVADPNVGSLLMFHYPSTWNHVLGDHATTFRVLPLSPTETELTTKWLVHKDAREGVDYDLKRLTEVWNATNQEDRRVCQENQMGVNSPSYEAGPYSPVHEAGVMQFVDWYRGHLIERLESVA
ncbi:MAG TPA: aromatic ring-hydroxylating dioxygenase subunit alpha [Steroidobacteraceae bacterium]|jgi:Rieske 2Fe-2S family protein